MKKILLGTSGLVAAVALYAGAAAAETPKVTVGGFVDFQAGIASDDVESNGSAVQQRAHGFRNDSEITFRADGKSDAGLNYGAQADLEADVTSDADNQGVNASRTFVFLDGAFGRFEMGSNAGAAQALKVDASNVASATGGINGAWGYFANMPTGSFVTSSELPLAHGNTAAIGSEDTDNNNKITYYSPRMSGVQLGISYAPDSADRGQTVSRTDNNAGQSGDNIDVALSYDNQYGDVSVAAAAAGEFGTSETSATEDLSAWNVGGSLGYAGFSVAGSYGNWGDSLAANGNDATYYTAGLAYNVGAFGTSVTYLNSTIDAGTDNDFSNIVVGADYKLAPGLTPYAEVSVYEFDAAGSANDNEGTVVLLGTQLAF